MSLQTSLDQGNGDTERPSIDESLEWLQREVWSLPVRDHRSDDEILGYNDHGHFGSRTDVRVAPYGRT